MRGEHEDLIDQHRAKMKTPEQKTLYRLRGETIELGFVQAKHNHKFTRFTARGRDLENTEVGLVVMVPNIKRIRRVHESAKKQAACYAGRPRYRQDCFQRFNAGLTQPQGFVGYQVLMGAAALREAS